MKILHRLFFVLGLFFTLFSFSFSFPLSAFADPITNAWISPTSGNWEEPTNWSLSLPPGPGQTVMLTNQGWKAVAIGPNTSQNFPVTLDVSSVILGGNTDSFNLLLLNYSGYETPLRADSVYVGTNSGITALASALTVSTNTSGPGDLSIFAAFNQGAQAIVNAHSITLGNVTNPAAGFGTYNQTNGIINADAISAWSGSTFNQSDGDNTIGGTLSLGGANGNNVAHYTIDGGSLTAGIIELQRGSFNQNGGSVTLTDGSFRGSLSIGAGTYTLSDGILQLPGITIPNAYYGPQNPGGFLGADATLLQTGGTNFCDGAMTVEHDYGAPGVGVPFLGPGRYVLSNGVLCVSSTVRSWMGTFEQWGGWHTNAGTAVDGDTFPNNVIHTGSFALGGGTLITPYISVNLGNFTQTAGTNNVSGNVGVGTGRGLASLNMSGGLLTDQNTFIDGSSTSSFGAQHASFSQSGGTHIVTNLLRLSGPPSDFLGGNQSPDFSGSYGLSGGVLNVPNITMGTNAFFNHNGGTLTTSGLLTMGFATWNERTSGQQFGQLLLSAPAGTNATFSLPSSNSCVVRFANSSSVAWSNQVTLLIANWNGSLNGGGSHQVYFGSDASGLTAQQLSQIQFKNPSGASGNFPARILSTGEIVPGRILLSHQSPGNNSMVLEWGNGSVLQSATNITGPWQDVSGATSPYTVSYTGPQRFFRVRQ